MPRSLICPHFCIDFSLFGKGKTKRERAPYWNFFCFNLNLSEDPIYETKLIFVGLMTSNRVEAMSLPSSAKNKWQQLSSSTRSFKIAVTERAYFFRKYSRTWPSFSTPDLLKTEMKRIYSELLNNSYPKKFIDRVKTRITNQAPFECNWTSAVCMPYYVLPRR